ncbi:MAG: type III-B CRISPR-associated protein Cas10/Cmr2, partial [Ktedonobacteraceae bacterium]|nr:type III-B CRISPR-associated protein Cas10/Cmr2 [Ktedonobacteraceae bacterium]
MPYLFLVSIGPVQSFIASARRTRDLWFGSQLLSELSKAAARRIADADLHRLIFPAPETLAMLEPSSSLNVANKIVASIDDDLSMQDLDELGTQVKQAIDDRLHEIRDRMYQAVGTGRLDREIADQQIDDLVEYSWVAVPVENGAAYAERRRQLEAVMAARKNTRDFLPVAWGSSRPKSSIDGQLESVLPDDLYPWKSLPSEQRQARSRNRYTYFRAGPVEQLSGVDLLKRRGTFIQQANSSSTGRGGGTDFLSTSHIATAPYLHLLETLSEEQKDEARRGWGRYIDHVKKVAGSEAVESIGIEGYEANAVLDRYDGGNFFLERILESAIPKGSANGEESLSTVQQALENFYRYVDECTGTHSRPSTYYAILQADGDSMGQMINRQAQGEGGMERHRAISRALDTFANEVRAIVQEHKGA